MAFKMMGGRPPKQKTGNGLPSGLIGGPKMKPCGGPMMTDPKDKDKKALTRDEEVQKRYPGAVKRKGTINDYDYKGTTLTPGVKKKKVLSDKEKIKEALNSKAPGKKQVKKGGPKQQTSKDKLDEKLGVKDGPEKDKSQSMKSRRDESVAMQVKPKKKGGMKQMDKKPMKKGGPKNYGKGPKQKESVKQEKKDLKENFLAKKMDPKRK